MRRYRPAAGCGVLLLIAGVGLAWPTLAAEAPSGAATDEDAGMFSLDAIDVSAQAFAFGTGLAAPYTGGLVAPGVHMGVWGQQQASSMPFSAVSFTDQLIQDQQADTIADVLENSAAVQTSSGYGNYAEGYMIRGFKLDGDDLSFAGLYGVLPRQTVTTQFVQRVELFKGASAFTNGVRPNGTGVGGAINLVPKTAREGELTRLRFGYVSDSHGEAALDVSRRFGADERFGMRVNLLHGSGEVAVDHEDRRLTTATIALDYQGERGHGLLFVGHQKHKNEGGRLSVTLDPSLTAIPEPPDAGMNYTPSWSRSDVDVTFGLLRGGYDLSDNWTAYGAIGANKTEEYGQYSQLNLLNADGGAGAGRLGVPYEAQTFTGQAGLRGQFLTGPVSHQTNLAYSGLYRRFDAAYTMAFAPTTPNTNIHYPSVVPYPPTDIGEGDLDDPNVRGRVHSNAVALSDTIGFLGDRLLVTLGLRYQDIEILNYDYHGQLSEVHSDDTVTPVYGVVYKPTEQVSLYANHIEALQPGSSAPIGTQNAGQSIGIAKSKQNEVGIKYDTDAFGAALSLYSIEMPGAYTNAEKVYGYFGEQRNRGVEVSLYGEPLEGLRLLTSATWIDAELTRTQNSLYNGNTAVGVPEYRIVLGAEWDVPHTERWTLLGRVVHTGSQYADEANKLKLDSWTRLDLGVRYDLPLASDKNLVLRANVENVTDADYWSKASGPFVYLNMGEPRTFKLSATLNF